MKYIEEFRVAIPSEAAEGRAVQDRIVNLLQKLGFTQRDVFAVRLALEEALVNAIKHGNHMDPEKRLTAACWIWNDGIRVTITDEGDGFRLEDVPDPTEESNLEKPGGRGIMLMRSFMDVVEYNERGNQVTLEKTIQK